ELLGKPVGLDKSYGLLRDHPGTRSSTDFAFRRWPRGHLDSTFDYLDPAYSRLCRCVRRASRLNRYRCVFGQKVLGIQAPDNFSDVETEEARVLGVWNRAFEPYRVKESNNTNIIWAVCVRLSASGQIEKHLIWNTGLFGGIQFANNKVDTAAR